MVEIRLVKGKMVIAPVQASGWTLDEFLAGITEDNLHREIDTGLAVGKEIW